MICFNEFDNDGHSVRRIPEAEAIAEQKRAGAQKGYVYADDQRALDDFIAVNWAWQVPDTGDSPNG